MLPRGTAEHPYGADFHHPFLLPEGAARLRLRGGLILRPGRRLGRRNRDPDTAAHSRQVVVRSPIHGTAELHGFQDGTLRQELRERGQVHDAEPRGAMLHARLQFARRHPGMDPRSTGRLEHTAQQQGRHGRAAKQEQDEHRKTIRLHRGDSSLRRYRQALPREKIQQELAKHLGFRRTERRRQLLLCRPEKRPAEGQPQEIPGIHFRPRQRTCRALAKGKARRQGAILQRHDQRCP